MAYLLWIALIFFTSAYLLRSYLWGISKCKNIKEKLPPGPRGLPILGNLHMLGENPHHDLHKLSQKYGSIMYLRLGFVPTIVVSSPEWAEQFLKNHDLIFASRPPHEAAKHMLYEQKSLSFAPYGPYWRNIRKMCTLELLKASKINSFSPMRNEEIRLLVQFLRKASINRDVVDLSAQISSMSANMSCQMLFGKKYMEMEFNERGFKVMMQEIMQLMMTPNLSDYLPYVGALDLQGLAKKMKAVNKVFDAFFEKIIDKHVETWKEGESRDFVDVLLGLVGSEKIEYHIERPNIKAILLDMYGASMDTSATAVEWAISELIRHPRVMKKVQKEIEGVVGMERMVEESDLDSLEYLDMVIKETFRLHPVAPLLLPHFSTEDCTINGYHIPRNSRIFINVWTIGRDPNVWPDPDKFLPERFECMNIDVRGRDFQLLPFGSGRRGCPGMQLGLNVVRLAVAQLAHCFDWDLPSCVLPSELDMTEEFGLTTPRAKPLMVIPSYRLKV